MTTEPSGARTCIYGISVVVNLALDRLLTKAGTSIIRTPDPGGIAAGLDAVTSTRPNRPDDQSLARSPASRTSSSTRSHRVLVAASQRKRLWAAGSAPIADAVSGLLGHVLALLVWAGAAWSCLQPARSRVKSTARIWARIGIAVVTCAALYAGSLAVISAANGTSPGAGASSASGTVQGDSAKQLAGCWGTDGYGNAEFMVSADTLQECEQFVSQLAAVPHDGILPGGAAALGGVQCLMIATSAAREPFSVTVGSDAPSNLCSLLAQDGYVQGPTP